MEENSSMYSTAKDEDAGFPLGKASTVSCLPTTVRHKGNMMEPMQALALRTVVANLGVTTPLEVK